MTIRRQMIVGCISLILPLCCLAVNSKDAEPIDDRVLAQSFLNGIIDKINSGHFIDMFAAGDVFAKVQNHVPQAECIVLLKEFEKDLFIIEPIRTNSWQRTSFMIDSVWNVYSALWRCAPGLTEEERWGIKFKALSWEYRQLNWLKRAAPADTRPLLQKRNNPRASYRTEYGKWQHTVFGVESTFYKRHIAKSLYEAEDDRYSDEFRAWCFKEIEKIIGRPLTDDDIMFKDEVLRRRAKRLVDRIPSSWNESIESFTNVAYKASVAINRIASQRNRLKCAQAYTNQIKRCLRNLNRQDCGNSSNGDCYNLSPERKEALLKMVIEVTGETPEWYQKELEGKKADMNTAE